MKKLLLLLLPLLLSMGNVLAQSEWKLKTEKEGIKIYTSAVADSKIKAIKVDAEFSASQDQLVALLMDIKNSPEWLYHTKSCIVVKQVSQSELYYYSEINLPWPVANRDFVAHLTVTQDPITKVITINGPSVPGFVPEKPGIVRVSGSSGKWVITPLGNNQIGVEYSIHVDPGGSVPSWLVNMFATEGPLKVFRNIKQELQKRDYRNAVLASVAK